MPRKAVYWKDPERHRKEVNNRHARLVALGIRRIDQLSPAAAAKVHAYQSKWLKANPARNRAACKRYRDKLRRLFGGTDAKYIWRHTMMREAESAKRRKLRIKSLSRKLVEGKRSADLVSRRPTPRRGLLRTRKVVLH